MKNRRKILFLFVLIIGVVGSILFFTNQKRELTIDEILKTDAYNYLSDNVKDFIKEHYEETEELYLTEKNFKDNEAYLNPSYIEYLDSTNKDSYSIIPSVTAYVPKLMAVNDNLPSSFDLRDVNGKNYVTPVKDQGNEGLCWAFATASLLETHDLIEKDKSYDSSAVLFSEKQMDYALSSNGIIGGNWVSNLNRTLSSGGSLNFPEKLLMERLGGFSDSWNISNNEKIKNNEPLEPNVVFNRDFALYEVDETVRYSNINSDYTNTESIENMTKNIKNIIYNYGGATVNIKSSGTIIKNILNNDYLAITSQQYYSGLSDQHALHIIGWDDNYAYEFCAGNMNGRKYPVAAYYENGKKICPTGGDSDGNLYPSYSVTGKGAWVLKNSYGNSQSYIYLPYNSFIDDIFAITKYSEKNWDDSNVISGKYDYQSSIYRYKLDNDMYNGDKVIKLKITLNSPKDIALYYSDDGNLMLIDNYSFDSAGVKTIDLQDKNLHIGENSFFQLNNRYEMVLFTSKSSDSLKAYTYDFTYKLEDDFPTSEKFLNVAIKTKLKNINDNEVINYKLKYKDGDYLPVNSYSSTINKSYYSMVTPIIKISEQYAKIGEYILETWKDSNLLYSSSVNLEVDYMPIDGDGSNENPWQITNTRQFNMIRNALNDNYILINDLDFEFDTQNLNGLFYNNGDGWSAIDSFKGNLNGNDKTLKNVNTASAIFNWVSGSGDCPYNKCGIHNLKVDGLIRHKCTQTTGGIIDTLSVIDTYSYDFSNLSITNSHFYADLDSFSYANNPYFYVGGIIGNLQVIGGSNIFKQTVLKIENWYSDYVYNVNKGLKNMTDGYIGGLIGEINSFSNTTLSINNTKTNAVLNINAGNNINYHISDIIGGISRLNDDFSINNSVGIINLEHGNNINVFSNAFVGKFIAENQTKTLKINGVKSNLPYTPNDKINITNYEDNLKSYEIARSNYSNYSYYENQYYVYNEQYDGTTKVLFEDKFNHIDNTIPMLKQFPEEYAEYAKTYSLKVGETKSISDLITKDSDNKKLNVYSEFLCDLDICNNVTDNTIISIPTLQNEYQFTGLKVGSTKLIIYDEISGYLDTVTINVIEENKEMINVCFDENSEAGIGCLSIEYGTKVSKPSNPTRDGYTFKYWSLNGEEFDFDTPITNDITLVAEWKEIIESDALKDILEYNGYTVTNSYVSKFSLGDTINQIKNNLGSNVTMETDKEIISTGAVIKKGAESYTVVIKGDLTGDGKVNSGDLLQMRKYLLEEITLTGAYKEAGIIESIGNIKSLDLLRLRQYLLGDYEFN